jgi:hypothetical protein
MGVSTWYFAAFHDRFDIKNLGSRARRLNIKAETLGQELHGLLQPKPLTTSHQHHPDNSNAALYLPNQNTNASSI